MASNKKANFDSKHTTVSVTQIKIVIYVIFDTPFHSPIPDRDSSPGLIGRKKAVWAFLHIESRTKIDSAYGRYGPTDHQMSDLIDVGYATFC